MRLLINYRGNVACCLKSFYRLKHVFRNYGLNYYRAVNARSLFLCLYRISAELSSVLVLKNYWITFLLAKGGF